MLHASFLASQEQDQERYPIPLTLPMLKHLHDAFFRFAYNWQAAMTTKETSRQKEQKEDPGCTPSGRNGH